MAMVKHCPAFIYPAYYWRILRWAGLHVEMEDAGTVEGGQWKW